MRTVALLLALLSVVGCASPQPAARSEILSREVECDVADGLVEITDLIAVGSDLRSVRAELTLERSYPHERWRPLIWVMVAERDHTNSVRVDLWQPPGWEELAIAVRRIDGEEIAWNDALAEGLAPGEPHAVTLDWSDPDRVRVTGDHAETLVPIEFEVRRVFAGCSGMKGRLRLPDLD
jgi:hypothetical protein